MGIEIGNRDASDMMIMMMRGVAIGDEIEVVQG